MTTDKAMVSAAPDWPEDPMVDVDESSSPPPDGGIWAWLQCAGGFCICFNTWGMLNSFGMNFTVIT